jgi:hypothetical protein
MAKKHKRLYRYSKGTVQIVCQGTGCGYQTRRYPEVRVNLAKKEYVDHM